jgi:ferredoxin
VASPGERGARILKIRADQSACKGHGLCFVVDQELFPLHDGLIAVKDDAEVPAGREANARLGVDSCPEIALEIVKD